MLPFFFFEISDSWDERNVCLYLGRRGGDGAIDRISVFFLNVFPKTLIELAYRFLG